MKQIPEEKVSNYALKAGEVLQLFGENKFYINPISDEQAETFLAKFPKRIVIFERYPADWKERAEARAKAAEETTEETGPAEQVQTTEHEPEGEGGETVENTEAAETEPETPTEPAAEEPEGDAGEVVIDDDGNAVPAAPAPAKARRTRK